MARTSETILAELHEAQRREWEALEAAASGARQVP